MLDTLDSVTNNHVEGQLEADLRLFKIMILEKLRADGWTIKAVENTWKVRYEPK